MKFNLNNHQIIFLFLSILFVVPSWLFSYFQYPSEDLILKILNDTVDTLYYTLAVNYSEFNFKPLYELNSSEISGITAYPILSVFIISFFWKLTGPLSFPLIQLISTFITLNIFFYLSSSARINKLDSLFISIFCLTLTFFFEAIFSLIDFSFLQTIKHNLINFYYYRFPRPIITNLFLFSYVYICFKIFYNNFYNYKHFVLLGIISGITLHLFYFFFVIQNIFLFLLILNRFSLKKDLISNQNIKIYSIYSLFLILFLLVYIFNQSFADKDYLTRLGPIDLNFEKRIVLFEYYYEFIINKIFITLLILNIVIYFLNRYYLKQKIFEFLNIIFFAAIISPILFFSVSPKVITIYHFFNWILILGTLNLIFISLFVVGKYLNQSMKKNLQIIYIFVSIFIVNYKLISSNIVVDQQRKDQSDIINFFKSNEKNLINKKFLVPNQTLFAWLSLNDYNNFDYVPIEMWTTRSNDRLEKDIIKVFKFFDLDQNDFKNYIKNEKTDFRMMNFNAYNFLGRKYIANKLKTFEDTDDYENYEFIKSIKPTISHSFAIPRYEINRLIKKFKTTNDIINPDYVVIKKNSFFKLKNFSNKGYCILKDNKTFLIYSSIDCD